MAMKGSGVQKLACSDIGLGPIGIKTLAETIPTIPGVVEVNLSHNKMISSDDLIKIEAEVPRLSALCRSEAKLLVDNYYHLSV